MSREAFRGCEEITSTQRPLRPQRKNLSKRCFARFAIFAFNVILSQALEPTVRRGLARKVGGCRKCRRPAKLRRLLVGVGELDERRFAPRAADERDPDRQSSEVTRGHRD